VNSRTKYYALKLLSKRDYFEEELKQKLLKKGFDKEKIEEVLAYLKQQNLLNDEKLKERLKEKSINKGKSFLKIKQKIYQKTGEFIEISENEELESAINLLKRSFKKEKTFENVVKFLKNRGFRYSIISKAANKFLNEEL
jgi:regulatory protein